MSPEGTENIFQEQAEHPSVRNNFWVLRCREGAENTSSLGVPACAEQFCLCLMHVLIIFDHRPLLHNHGATHLLGWRHNSPGPREAPFVLAEPDAQTITGQ